MSVNIRELSDDDLKVFVKFPFGLYKTSKQWVPPIIKDEITYLNRRRNKSLKDNKIRYFVAYREEKILGRIATIINSYEISKLNKKKIRFGWFDFVDDFEVSRALIDKVCELGISEELDHIEGPMGVSVIDKAGMLTMGFELNGKASTIYNYDYYPKHMEVLGLKPLKKWVEYGIHVPDDYSRIQKFSDIISNKFQLKDVSLDSKESIMKRAHEMFDVMNVSFKDLPTFTKMEPSQIDYYKKKYANFIYPDYVAFLFDKHKKMIGFGITVPDFSRALQRTRGRLFPCGIFYLLRAFKKAKKADLTIIGVHPDYQKKGLIAVIFAKIITSYKRIGITYVEVGPGLEENANYQAMWRHYDSKIIRRRATFTKNI